MMDSRGDVAKTFGNTDHGLRLDRQDYEIVEDGRKIVQAAFIRHEGGEDGVMVEESVPRGGSRGKSSRIRWRSLDHVPRNQSLVGLDEPDYLSDNPSLLSCPTAKLFSTHLPKQPNFYGSHINISRKPIKESLRESGGSSGPQPCVQSLRESAHGRPEAKFKGRRP